MASWGFDLARSLLLAVPEFFAPVVDDADLGRRVLFRVLFGGPDSHEALAVGGDFERR